MYTPKRFDYIGVDETTAGPNWDSFVVVAAETQRAALARPSRTPLMKARDYLRRANCRDGKPDLCALPSIDELLGRGLAKFYWTRARPGSRFNRPEVEHGTIAHVVTHNGYKPETTVVLVDAFHTNYAYSQDLLMEYFHAQGFNISRRNIEIIGGGDVSIPIVNYADILAFQIGVALGQRHSLHTRVEPNVHLRGEVPFDHRRTLPLTEQGRELLERILRNRGNRRAA